MLRRSCKKYAIGAEGCYNDVARFIFGRIAKTLAKRAFKERFHGAIPKSLETNVSSHFVSIPA